MKNTLFNLFKLLYLEINFIHYNISIIVLLKKILNDT
jgi:hypothetical protein